MIPQILPRRRRPRARATLSFVAFACLIVIWWMSRTSSPPPLRASPLISQPPVYHIALPQGAVVPVLETEDDLPPFSHDAINLARNQTVRGRVPMPYRYPMHAKLPSAERIVNHIYRDHLAHQEQRCWGTGAAHRPIFYQPPSAMKRERNAAAASSLATEYSFQDDGHGSGKDEPFFSTDTPDPVTYSDDDMGVDHSQIDTHSPWWAPSHMDQWNLPCTSEVQARLHQLQHPSTPCHKMRYLVTKLKEGAHGVGSALTLVAHDLLSSIIVGRVLQVHTSSKWFFASQHCAAAGRGGWECFFSSVASCKAQGAVEIVNHRRQAIRSTAPVITKKNFDIDGLSRNDIPSEELFFGDIRNSQCFAAYKEWVADPANTYIQGTFERGADPALFYMLSQAMRYLLRNPQPWVRRMLQHHLPQVGLPGADLLPTTKAGHGAPVEASQASKAILYVQERGEIAKFREYYNVFGCHNINSTIFLDVISRWCAGSTACSVYISGNTPFKNFLWLERELTHHGDNSITVLSTWKHKRLSAGLTAESERWGASSPASSWMDLFAGVASTNWVCIVQSNWCRVINFLRLTAGRAPCGFLDGGALMIASPLDRERYCIVGPYPTKAFSNRLK